MFSPLPPFFFAIYSDCDSDSVAHAVPDAGANRVADGKPDTLSNRVADGKPDTLSNPATLLQHNESNRVADGKPDTRANRQPNFGALCITDTRPHYGGTDDLTHCSANRSANHC